MTPCGAAVRAGRPAARLHAGRRAGGPNLTTPDAVLRTLGTVVLTVAAPAGDAAVLCPPATRLRATGDANLFLSPAVVRTVLAAAARAYAGPGVDLGQQLCLLFPDTGPPPGRRRVEGPLIWGGVAYSDPLGPEDALRPGLFVAIPVRGRASASPKCVAGYRVGDGLATRRFTVFGVVSRLSIPLLVSCFSPRAWSRRTSGELDPRRSRHANGPTRPIGPPELSPPAYW